MEQALKLGIAELNAQGGLLGRTIEMIVFDIGDLTPDKLQAAGIYLVEKENVDVLINGYGGMGPDIPAFCQYPVPYLHVDGTANVIELRNQMNCENIFMIIDTSVNYGKISFDQLTKIGYEYPSKTVAFVEGPLDWEFGMTGGAEEVGDSLGWKVVHREKVEYGITEWGPILTKLRQKNPALIYVEILDPAAVNTFVEQFVSDPPKGSLLHVGYLASVPGFGEVITRGLAEGVLGMTPSANMPDEKGREFVEKWRQAYNEDPALSIAAEIYDEVMFWAAAVNKVGSVDDYAAINDALRTMTFEGVTGIIKLNDQQFLYSSDETAPSQLLQVQDGKLVQIMIGSKKYADFVMPPWLE